MAIRDFRDLLIWQRAMDVARIVYRITESFPSSELYGLTSQLRRAAVSVPSNIAEGHGRESEREFGRFLRISRGSLAELQTQLILAEGLGYAGADSFLEINELIEELGRMMRGMQKALDSQLTTLD
ncbi:MAG: four helix bundle protein [Sulfuricellaceae bacterium]|jgi:four helix bundle protein